MLSKLILIRETDHQRAPVLLKKRKAKRMNRNSLSLYGFKGLEKVPGHESPWHRKPQGQAAAWVLQQEKITQLLRVASSTHHFSYRTHFLRVDG